jgi:putative inorganic carbon (hco3(-)) transporter
MNGIMTPRVFDSRALPLIAGALGATAVAFASSRSPLLAIAALVAVVLIIFVLTQPQTVLMIMLAVFPWEGMLDFPTHTLTVTKILGFLLVVSVTLSAVAQGTKLRAPPATIAAFAFVLFALLSLIASPDPSAGVAQILRYTLFVAFFFIAIQLLDTRARLLRAIRVLILSLSVAALWGLIGFVSGSEPRAGGPISDPNEFGYMLATMLPLCVYLILEDKHIRSLWVVCFPLILGATLATLSRGAFVGLVVMVIWAALTRRIRPGDLLISTVSVFALVAVGFTLFGSVVNERVEQKGRIASKNSQSRKALWAGALEMSMDHPIMGVGPGRFGAESVNYIRNDPILLVDPQAHNAYLELLAESGPFALAAFLTFLGLSWRTLRRMQNASRLDGIRADERLATALQASLLVAIVGAIFISEHVASPFWVICSFAAAASATGRLGIVPETRTVEAGDRGAVVPEPA